jgi:hypothetical protein
MQKLLTLAMLFLLLTPIPQVAAQSDCYRVEIRFTADESTELNGKVSTFYENALENGFVDFELDPLFDDDEKLSAGETVNIGSYEINGPRPSVSINDSAVDSNGDFEARVVGCDAPQDPLIADGRLNADDLAAPAVIYATNSGYTVYAINPVTGNGRLVLSVTTAQVTQALSEATTTGTNANIATVDGISLWALSSNECQMNAFAANGSLYEFIFACAV